MNNNSLEEKNGSTNSKSILQSILNLCTILLTLAALIGLIITVWQIVPSTNRYTVTFNANGGNGGVKSQTFVVKNGVSKNQWLYGGTPTRIGYTFVCWNNKVDGSGTDLYNGVEIPPLGNYTLYAVWTPIIKTFTLKFNPNGGIGGNSSQLFIGVPTDNEDTVPKGILNGGVPTRSGYTFLYWNSESDGRGITNYYNGDELNVVDNATLYAVWKRN